MSEKSDWIRLPIKFKGKCVTCGKEIPVGENALWSRRAKAIKHIDCAVPEKREETKQSEFLQLECFVCGRTAGCAECSLTGDCDRVNVSPMCICEACLDQGDPYKAYQQAFLARLKKVPKVKI